MIVRQQLRVSVGSVVAYFSSVVEYRNNPTPISATEREARLQAALTDHAGDIASAVVAVRESGQADASFHVWYSFIQEQPQ